MKKTVLRKYAHLIAAKGVNVQKGQEVFIVAELDQPEFVKMLVEECYKLGAKTVVVDWTYQPLQKVNTRYRSLKTLSTLEDYDAARWQHYVNVIPCRIYLESEDPDGLKGIDQKKLSKAMQKKMPLIRSYRDQIENKYQWCIAAVPGEKWARKLFPELSKRQAVEKLWEAILSCARVTDDPMAAWDAHNKDLKERCKYLNSLGIDSLEYKSSNGTDFKVWMIEGSHFNGGADTSLQGIVYATKPLSYNGQLIENFWVRFEDGKATKWGAEKGEDILGEIIKMDEGSCMLGEVALVPYDSPIQNSGLLFYNTLFDENAACHLALGFGFADTIDGFENMTLAECQEKGVNKSFMHVDFMIGSADLSIVANTRDGKKVQIFKDGNWAF
ncbi:MAG: aminopeptidase [Firmicutes bacterium]|nr:aminopeptidase [Bacillota bacterium]